MRSKTRIDKLIRVFITENEMFNFVQCPRLERIPDLTYPNIISHPIRSKAIGVKTTIISKY